VIRLLHVIAGLELGGVQIVLYRLLSRIDRAVFQNQVISLTDIGVVGRRIRALGVPVEALGMRPGVPDPRGLLRLARWFRRWRPDVIQTWMYHSDLMGGLAAWMTGSAKPVWGVHYGRLDPQENPLHTRATARVCAWLSGWLPARIVCCAEFTRQTHRQLGYPDDKMLTIPNGVDLETFHPDPSAPASVRRELGLPEDALLVGLMARWDPQKDHRNFVRAAARLHARLPDAHFLLCGIGITWENAALAAWIEAERLRHRFHLLGERDDIARLMAALDVATLASSSEAYGNVVSEAMACGVPCVVTDTGDLPQVVGDTGRVVPIKDPEALAQALHQVLILPPEDRQGLGRRARRRVEEHYDLDAAVARYQQLYLEVAGAARSRANGPMAQ
jgi:glycosyltransferase involved in cell wall biosynthesis